MVICFLFSKRLVFKINFRNKVFNNKIMEVLKIKL